MTTENPNDHDEPIIRDKRRIDPVTGKVRGAGEAGADASAPAEPVEAETDETGESPDAADGPGLSDEDLEGLLSGAGAEDAPVEPAAAPEDEHLRDLQRVTAEYANYRRRTEREKAEARDLISADVLRGILPALDDFDRAEQHGDLTEGSPVEVIVAKLRGLLEKQGLEPYGEAGEPFDPTVHEAIAQLPNADVEVETIADVVTRGYRVGDRTVRVAKVAVFVPAS